MKINKQVELTKQNKKSYTSFGKTLDLSNHFGTIGGQILFNSIKEPITESNCTIDDNKNKTTENIVKAYLSAKDRIDKLNITSLLS